MVLECFQRGAVAYSHLKDVSQCWDWTKALWNQWVSILVSVT